MRPTPNVLRLRRLLIQHTCQATTELSRQSRMDDLADTDLQRCVWCGSWTDGRLDGFPCWQHCAPIHLIGETP